MAKAADVADTFDYLEGTWQTALLMSKLIASGVKSTNRNQLWVKESLGPVSEPEDGLEFAGLACDRCGETLGWRFEAGSSGRPSHLKYLGRCCLMTPKVMKQVASGDGYIMFEGFERLPASVLDDCRLALNKNSTSVL